MNRSHTQRLMRKIRARVLPPAKSVRHFVSAGMDQKLHKVSDTFGVAQAAGPVNVTMTDSELMYA